MPCPPSEVDCRLLHLRPRTHTVTSCPPSLFYFPSDSVPFLRFVPGFFSFAHSSYSVLAVEGTNHISCSLLALVSRLVPGELACLLAALASPLFAPVFRGPTTSIQSSFDPSDTLLRPKTPRPGWPLLDSPQEHAPDTCSLCTHTIDLRFFFCPLRSSTPSTCFCFGTPECPVTIRVATAYHLCVL